MKVDRSEFLSLLRLLKPALASEGNSVPELSYIWFDGKYASAFDGIIGIRVAFETEFTGGLQGNCVIGMLENSTANEIEVERQEKGNMFLVADTAEIALASRPIDDWFWQPELPGSTWCEVTKELLDAISMVMISVGEGKVLSPEQRGVTVIQNGKAADLYATDTVTLSWMRVPTKSSKDFPSSTILPTPFCEQFRNTPAGATLSFGDGGVFCLSGVKLTDKAEAREMLLFSRLIENADETTDLAAVADDYNGEAEEEIKLPKGALQGKIDRALYILDENQPVELAFAKGKLLKLYARTARGVVDDEFNLAKSSHADIKVKIDLKLLRRGIDGRETLSITDRCLVLRGPGEFVHIVSTK